MRYFAPASLALLLVLGGCATEASGYGQAQIGVGVDVGLNADFAPPPLPDYAQPPLPGDGYVWTPGYWAWNAGVSNYYWTPGVWVLPPRAGFLWTPPYWAWRDGVYAFHTGYWGPHVGFYGGINYGFGYGGFGFGGGEWRGGRFFYNRAVTNVSNVNITNVYNRTVINNTTTRTSFNGGAGVRAEPRPEDLAAARESHVLATPEQQRHFQAARAEPGLRASMDHGAPAGAATAQAGAIHGPGPGFAARSEATSQPAAEAHPSISESHRTELASGAESVDRPAVQHAPAAAPKPASFVRPGPPAGRPPANNGHPGGEKPAASPPRHPGGGRPGGGHRPAARPSPAHHSAGAGGGHKGEKR